jgi:hypothetical protein
MGGGKKVTYEAPVIPQDNSFQKYLEYQQDREKAAEERAAAERAASAAANQARLASAQAAMPGLQKNVQNQLRMGLISYNDAVSQLRDQASKGGWGGNNAVNELTEFYTSQVQPQRTATGTAAAYEELLGRQATSEELSKAQERFSQGYYTSIQDLKDSLTKSSEYQDKFNQNYLDNYYDTMFGKQSVDAAGKKTGQRTFKFDKNLLPTYTGTDLAERAQVITPDFKDSFTGTSGEIQEQLQNVRDTRQYLYSAGLTNLQGEIDKETQKLKNEGGKDIAKISSQGDIYKQLVGAFSF